MLYTSTRDNNLSVSSAQAIEKGISVEGGLFVPTEIPCIDKDFLNELKNKSYIDRAKAVLSLFLTDYTAEELDYCITGAYGTGFAHEDVAPVVKLHDNVHILELWHGPTCAFKDMALQLLPYLLTTASKKGGSDKEIVILVATSGDTGKAALEGFKDVDGTRILVFFPNDGVSPMQKLQMTTQAGNNVGVSAIYGNFDDAQTGVKKIFTNPEIRDILDEKGFAFSSANSINWGRLAPQIVYYFSAYCDLLKKGEIANGDKINIVVPTGNFGNILAAYYAEKMGLPVKKLICASNANNVLTDFLTTGTYDRNRPFHTTVSPSMDILISSNLERLLYDMCGKDDAQLRAWMTSLNETGAYTVSDNILKQIKDLFAAGCCDDKATAQTIGEVYNTYNYLCDTHTAVAVNVYEEYRKQTGDTAPAVIASTASPFKFSAAVLDAVSDKELPADEFSMVEELQERTANNAPAQLLALKGATPRFTGICNKEEMRKVVFDMLGI